MGIERSRFQLWVGLCSYHIGMIREFNNFYKKSITTGSWNMESVFFKLFSIIIIKFVAMAMSFLYGVVWICLFSFGSGSEDTLIASESHRSSFVRYGFLMIHDMYNMVSALVSCVKFFTRCIAISQYVSGIFNSHNLWP